jgi:hypothetical protein
MKKITARHTLFAPLAAMAALWAGSLSAQEAQQEAEEEQKPDEKKEDVWRPTPPVTHVPYPLRPVVPKEKQRHTRLNTMSLDGTFESYKSGTQLQDLRDDINRGLFFNPGGCRLDGTGYKSRVSMIIPSGGGNTCGIEEKNIPLKPDTWYRVSMMAKGIAYKMVFYYPVKPPDTGNDYANEVVIDHNFGSGYGFYCVCSKCDFVKGGRPEDGNWVLGGFKEIPDTCPECGAEGSLYRDGDRRYYPEWTYIYADFKTSDYVGRASNGVYYWWMIFIGTAANTWIDDFLVYEITGEGGDPVGGDEYVATTNDTKDANAVNEK